MVILVGKNTIWYKYFACRSFDINFPHAFAERDKWQALSILSVPHEIYFSAKFTNLRLRAASK